MYDVAVYVWEDGRCSAWLCAKGAPLPRDVWRYCRGVTYDEGKALCDLRSLSGGGK